MNKYLVLKNTGRGTAKGRSAVFINLDVKGSRAVHLSGNIPELYHGMIISMETDDKYVLDYSIDLSDERNIAALNKAEINVGEYAEVLKRHMILKNDGIGWNSAILSITDLYKTLPFCEADKVHKEMVNMANEPVRMDAINKKIIDSARQRRKIAYSIDEYLSYFGDVEQEGAYQQLMLSIKMLSLQASSYGFKGGKVWDNELKSKEDFVKENITKRNAFQHSLLTEDEIKAFLKKASKRGLADEQLNTLWSLENTMPCIITGGAGSGKTTVIKTIIDCYSMHYEKKNVLLAAPTGKAARRLSEKTQMSASTIHKALRKNPEDDYVYYTQDNPLPHRLVVVDESSMIDMELMYDLLSAVSPTSKIIFVGDHNQLYPVGYGEPFFNFLSELQVFRLVLNHRQSEETDILQVANNILEGKPCFCGRGVHIAEIGFADIGGILDTADEDTQIISPYNSLNADINHYLRLGEDELNAGDKVMTLKNTKEYSNGDIGVVEKIDSKGDIVIRINNKTVKVLKSHTDDITLAYSITVHKMQGSEAKRVIAFIPKGDRMVDKRMLYTAVTRAKEKLELYYYTV